MRVDLNARAKTIDGHDAGHVERAVIDPETNEVCAFVVSTGGLLGRSVIVPRIDLERASQNGDLLVLALSKDELSDLQPYEPASYESPPFGWTPLSADGYPMPGYLWPAGYTYTPPPPIAIAAPTGSDDALTVDKGAMVVDQDGQEVGVVDDVYFEQDGGRLRGVLVRLGGFVRTTLGGGDTVEIGWRMIDRVSGGVVYLYSTKDELKHVA